MKELLEDKKKMEDSMTKLLKTFIEKHGYNDIELYADATTLQTLSGKTKVLSVKVEAKITI